MKRLCHTLCSAFVYWGLAACASEQIPDIEPGERPTVESEEGGLWMMLDRAEQKLKTSGRVVEDEALQDYLEGVLCRIDPEYCPDVRLYVLRVPDFNAAMAPNGVMHIWTGALLRMENEAQLAYLLGHELVHFKSRHSLKQWKSARAKLDTAVIVGTLGGPVGQSLAVLATVPSLYAFSREQEREADLVGFELVERAGYAPEEVVKIWRLIKEEVDAEGEDEVHIFLATHPEIEERIGTLQELADEAGVPEDGWLRGQEEYLAAVRPHRGRWLQSELKRRRFERTQVIFDHLIAGAPEDVELLFYQGELYRLRGGVLDDRKAAATYEQAIALGDAPVQTHRSLGLVYWDQGEKEKAEAAFIKYLELDPVANDRAIIESYLQQLRQTSS